MILLALIALLTSTAAAQVSPPVEFDFPYPGKLYIERVAAEQMPSVCGKAATGMARIGCAFPRFKDVEFGLRLPASCFVFIVDDAGLKRAGYSFETTLRHEIAHCNGWLH